MIYGLMLIALSIIAVPSLLLSRKPDAAELLDKVTPYQAIIGLVFCIIGLWGILQSVLGIGVLSYNPIWWLTLLAGRIVQAGLGFLLGYPLINTLILSSSPEAVEKGREIREKLAPWQGKLGMVGIGVGIWMILSRILFFV